MKQVETGELVSVLRKLTEEGREVSMPIVGSSMEPFLKEERDRICFRKPDRPVRKGDIIFYQRENGQYVLHRIKKVVADGYYLIGDAQTQMEGPIKGEQIFALITKVQRKGKWIDSGDFWWVFFAHVWLHVIPLRIVLMRGYGTFGRLVGIGGLTRQ